MWVAIGFVCETSHALKYYVPVAQLDRALASGAKGRAFESPQARFLFIGLTQSRLKFPAS